MAADALEHGLDVDLADALEGAHEEDAVPPQEGARGPKKVIMAVQHALLVALWSKEWRLTGVMRLRYDA